MTILYFLQRHTAYIREVFARVRDCRRELANDASLQLWAPTAIQPPLSRPLLADSILLVFWWVSRFSGCLLGYEKLVKSVHGVSSLQPLIKHRLSFNMAKSSRRVPWLLLPTVVPRGRKGISLISLGHLGLEGFPMFLLIWLLHLFVAFVLFSSAFSCWIHLFYGPW